MARMCRRGLHEMAGDNLKPNGNRFRCRACHLAYLRVYQRGKREAGTAWEYHNKDRKTAFNTINKLKHRIRRRRQVKLQQIDELVEEFNNG